MGIDAGVLPAAERLPALRLQQGDGPPENSAALAFAEIAMLGRKRCSGAACRALT